MTEDRVRIELVQVPPEKREVLDRLNQFMHYEIGMEPGPDGRIDWGESLDRFFSDTRSVPLFFVSGGAVCGYALVHLDRRYPGPDWPRPADQTRMNLLDEFYVCRPWRRKGVGTLAVHLILGKYPGLWVVTCWSDEARVSFWHHATTSCPGGRTQEYTPGEHKGFPGQHVWVVDSARECSG